MNYVLRDNKRCGFTLIELLVVISIIGILSSVALVNFNNVRYQAKQRAAEVAFKSMTNGIELCFAGGGDFTLDGTHRCNDEDDEPSIVIGSSICTNNGNIGKVPNLDNWEIKQCNSDSTFGNFFIYAISLNGPDCTIVCDQTGCRKEGSTCF